MKPEWIRNQWTAESCHDSQVDDTVFSSTETFSWLGWIKYLRCNDVYTSLRMR